VLRRRRALFFGGLLVVVLAVVAAVLLIGAGLRHPGQVAGAVSSAPSATTSASPSATATAAATPTTAPTGPAPSASPSVSAGASASPACDENLVTVAASTDAASYAAGQQPVFTLKVTNTGTAACQVNVGTSQQEFSVLSGQDRIFDSRDCQQNPQDKTLSLAAGASETANFVWQRNRTEPGCAPVTAVPGPGSYTLTVSLGARISAKHSFELK
jgi:hypothetical protein